MIFLISLVACLLSFSELAVSAQQTNQRIAEGEVVTIEPGVIYFGGLAHKLVSLKTLDGPMAVAVPATGMLPVRVGERLVASGRPVVFRGKPLIDPREGYVYRAVDKEMAQVVADQQVKVLNELKAQFPGAATLNGEPAKVENPGVQVPAPAASGEPATVPNQEAQFLTPAVSSELDAVPITLIESSQQRRGREAQEAAEATNRRLNLLIGIVSILLTVMAIEKRPYVIQAGVRYVGRTLRRAFAVFRIRRRR